MSIEFEHLKQEATTNAGEVVWEPFGGLFTGSLAARRVGRRSFAAEIDSTYYQYGVDRFRSEQLTRAEAGAEKVTGR